MWPLLLPFSTSLSTLQMWLTIPHIIVCTLHIAWANDTFSYVVESPTNLIVLIKYAQLDGLRQVIRVTHSMGPSLVPCGTPPLIVVQSDIDSPNSLLPICLKTLYPKDRKKSGIPNGITSQCRLHQDIDIFLGDQMLKWPPALTRATHMSMWTSHATYKWLMPVQCYSCACLWLFIAMGMIVFDYL